MTTDAIEIEWEPTVSEVLLEVDGWRLVRTPPIDRYAVAEGKDLFAEVEQELQAQHQRTARGEEWIHQFLMRGLNLQMHGDATDDDSRVLVSPEGQQWRCFTVLPGSSGTEHGWRDETYYDREGPPYLEDHIDPEALWESVPEALRGFVMVQTRASVLDGLYNLPSRNYGVPRLRQSYPVASGVQQLIAIGRDLDWLEGERSRRMYTRGEPRRYVCGEYPSVRRPEHGDVGEDWWQQWSAAPGATPAPCGGELTWFESVTTWREVERPRVERDHTTRDGWRCSWCDRVSSGPRPNEVGQSYRYGSCMPVR